MTVRSNFIRVAAVAIGAAALVSACGGSDYNNAVDSTAAVPPTASESVDGFIAYLKLLVASSADTLEPVDTSMVTAPTDETSEPQRVD